MQTLAEIKSMLAAHGLSPRKQFGQNFLIDHNLIRKLVDAAAVGAGETVLEIGPGTGTMTEELLDRGCRVIAAEIDRGLAAMLRERFADRPNFTLVEGDCLDGKRSLNPALLEAIGPGPFALVSNLPYGAGTPVMTILLAKEPRCRGLFVTIQREVADRMGAGPGSKDYGPISVLAACVAEVELVGVLPPACFWPRPDVTSAMVAVRRKAATCCEDPEALHLFCSMLFEKRRKQLGAVLGRSRPFPPGIAPEARAESLGIVELRALHEWYKSGNVNPASDVNGAG